MSRRRGSGPVHAAPPAEVLGARLRGQLLVNRTDVERAVDQLAVRLALEFGDANPWLLAVMHGALPFAGALLPRLGFPLQVGYLHVGRYRDATRGGELIWHAEPDYDLRGRVVLLVDDVLDRGDTLAALVRWATAAGAVAVKTVVLVDKLVDAQRPIAADFTALECPDRYLFGCGMDYRGYWRNLPDIYALPVDMERD